MDDQQPNSELGDDTGRYAHRSRDAALVEAARAGDQSAFGKLYDAWFDRVFDLARRIVRDEETAADVAHDTFLAAWQNLDRLADPQAFGGWLLRITRNTSFNRQRKEMRSTAADPEALAMIERSGSTGTGAPAGFTLANRFAAAEDPVRAVEDRELAALLWESADALGERDAQVLDLSLRHGMTPAEIGEIMGMNRNAANQLVHRVKGRLDAAVRARVLWAGGTPACPELAAAVRAEGITTFDGDAVAVISKHAARCGQCEDRQRSRLAPSAMFASIPIAAPILLKQKVAAALISAGVPLEGSTVVTNLGSGHATANGSSASTEPSEGDTGLGQHRGDAGTLPDGSVAGSRGLNGSSRLGRRSRILAAAATIVIVALVAIVAMSRGRDQPEPELATGTSPPTTPEPGATGSNASEPATTEYPGQTSETSSTSTATMPTPTTTAEPTTTLTPPTPPPTTPPPTQPPPARITFTIQPSEVITPYHIDGSAPYAPILRWSVTGGAAVRVWGPGDGRPDGFSSSQRQGSAALCPVLPDDPVCSPAPGTYEYRIEVRAADGTLLGAQTARLTVLAPPIP